MSLSPPRAVAIPLLGFSAVWDGFLVFWYAMAFRARNAPLMMFLFPLVHVGAGVFITRMALVRLLNSSRITLDASSFSLVTGPIPQRGAREATANLERFEAFETQSRRSSSWSVRMLTRDGRAVTLSLPLDRGEHVRFVAARLNEALRSAREPRGYRE
jgi:hypothetical protein